MSKNASKQNEMRKWGLKHCHHYINVSDCCCYYWQAVRTRTVGPIVLGGPNAVIDTDIIVTALTTQSSMKTLSKKMGVF